MSRARRLLSTGPATSSGATTSRWMSTRVSSRSRTEAPRPSPTRSSAFPPRCIPPGITWTRPTSPPMAPPTSTTRLRCPTRRPPAPRKATPAEPSARAATPSLSGARPRPRPASASTSLAISSPATAVRRSPAAASIRSTARTITPSAAFSPRAGTRLTADGTTSVTTMPASAASTPSTASSTTS